MWKNKVQTKAYENTYWKKTMIIFDNIEKQSEKNKHIET